MYKIFIYDFMVKYYIFSCTRDLLNLYKKVFILKNRQTAVYSNYLIFSLIKRNASIISKISDTAKNTIAT